MTRETLRAELLRMDGRGYPGYRSLKGAYDFDAFTLRIDRVQGDPFAPPSRAAVVLDFEAAGFPAHLLDNRSRRIGLADYLTRRFGDIADSMPPGRREGSGRSGTIDMARPGPEILERTSVQIRNGDVEARFVVGLPGRGRRIDGRAGAELLCDVLPALVEKTLVFSALDAEHLAQHVRANEDQDALRDALDAQNLVAFVADGSILPRASGADSRPMREGAVPFESPQSLQVTLEAPHAGPVTGMGIRKGVTVIAGGGFHGKSTLLQALESGIYNHVPGDGREQVVASMDTVKVRAEEGRYVSSVDLRPFINNLPGGADTCAFSTPNASGSTSQAASILEAIEVGARVLLMDEDTSATNFMIRDARMQALIPGAQEPITPLVDRVRGLFQREGISTILVMGGSGAYLDVADLVLLMTAYRAEDATERAREIAERFGVATSAEPGRADLAMDRSVEKGGLSVRKGRRDVSVRARERGVLEAGTERVDLRAVDQIVSREQVEAIGGALARMARWVEREALSVKVLLERIEEDVRRGGLDALADEPIGTLAAVRTYETAAALNRWRTAEIVRLSDDA